MEMGYMIAERLGWGDGFTSPAREDGPRCDLSTSTSLGNKERASCGPHYERCAVCLNSLRHIISRRGADRALVAKRAQLKVLEILGNASKALRFRQFNTSYLKAPGSRADVRTLMQCIIQQRWVRTRGTELRRLCSQKLLSIHFQIVTGPSARQNKPTLIFANHT